MAQFIKISTDEVINLDSVRRITKSPKDGHANIFYISGDCSTHDSYDELMNKINSVNMIQLYGEK